MSAFLKDGGTSWALLDSGASDVVRPDVERWREAILSGRVPGKRVAVVLAGGATQEAVLTGRGEVKIKDSVDQWILPLGRIVTELGALVIWISLHWS